MTFYTQQWEEYHAHVLRTFIGNFGVTEGEFYQYSSTIFRSYGHSNYHHCYRLDRGWTRCLDTI